MPPKKRARVIPTQDSLASVLGVSQMTVSRVLNDQPGVSKALKKKVLSKMKRSGYVPNFVARSLVSRTVRIIGLVIPDISNSFFPDITRSLEIALRDKGYQVMLAHSHESYEREVDEINLLISRRVDGLVIAPSGNQRQVDIYHTLAMLKIPFVFVDREKPVACSSVTTDTEQGARMLGEYLVSKGYRRWGYLKGPSGVSSSRSHEKGLHNSVCDANVDIIAFQAGFSEEDGYRVMGRLLQRSPDVVVAVNDPVAIGAYRYLKEHDMKIPDDVALVGFSDVRSADILEIPLTTVKEFPGKIGEEAAALLLASIENPSAPVRRVKIPPELIARKST